MASGSPEAGEIYRVTLTGHGHEQTGTRPVVVIQVDDADYLSTRLCVPLSTSAPPARWRVPVEVEGQSTLALTEQARAVSTERLKKPIGKVDFGTLSDIRSSVASLIGFWVTGDH